MTQYFFSKEGDYLGGFEGKEALALVPEDAIAVLNPPKHGKDKLINGVIVPYAPEVPLPDQLNEFFETNLPEEAQADLAPLKAAVKLELDQGRENIAKLIIQRAQIPAELEPLRAQMLERFK